MAGRTWHQLLKNMPYFLLEWESTWLDCVRIGDAGAGRYVLFSRQGNDVEITLRLPGDAAAADRLLAVLRAQPDATRWRPLPGSGRIWATGWRNTAPVADREAVSESVVDVMLQGLEMDEERLRIRSWGDDGPREGTYGLMPDRPSESGAAPTCTGWADLTARLDWSLHTLPVGGVLVLDRGTAREPCHIRFLNERRLESQAAPGNVAGLGPEEFDRRMAALGWSPGDPGWTGPEVRLRHDTRGVPERTVATFREVFGLAGPGELVFTAFRNGPGSDAGLRYLDAELGLPRREG